MPGQGFFSLQDNLKKKNKKKSAWRVTLGRRAGHSSEQLSVLTATKALPFLPSFLTATKALPFLPSFLTATRGCALQPHPAPLPPLSVTQRWGPGGGAPSGRAVPGPDKCVSTWPQFQAVAPRRPRAEPGRKGMSRGTSGKAWQGPHGATSLVPLSTWRQARGPPRLARGPPSLAPRLLRGMRPAELLAAARGEVEGGRAGGGGEGQGRTARPQGSARPLQPWRQGCPKGSRLKRGTKPGLYRVQHPPPARLHAPQRPSSALPPPRPLPPGAGGSGGLMRDGDEFRGVGAGEQGKKRTAGEAGLAKGKRERGGGPLGPRAGRGALGRRAGRGDRGPRAGRGRGDPGPGARRGAAGEKGWMLGTGSEFSGVGSGERVRRRASLGAERGGGEQGGVRREGG